MPKSNSFLVLRSRVCHCSRVGWRSLAMESSIFARLGKRRVLPTSKKMTRRSAMTPSYRMHGRVGDGVDPPDAVGRTAVTGAGKNCNIQLKVDAMCGASHGF